MGAEDKPFDKSFIQSGGSCILERLITVSCSASVVDVEAVIGSALLLDMTRLVFLLYSGQYLTYGPKQTLFDYMRQSLCPH